MFKSDTKATDDRAAVLEDVCSALMNDRPNDAADILRTRYPFLPLSKSYRRYSPTQCMIVFSRDGFVDRYSGRRLVFPGTMRLLSRLLPYQFPFHNNWKTDACHCAFYELFPTIDHVNPVSRGGIDDVGNWVTTSMLLNSAKANFTLGELGWTIYPPGNMNEWDGLTNWFLRQIEKSAEVLQDPYLRRWHTAANSVLGPNNGEPNVG
jgi:hypothetical protein